MKKGNHDDFEAFKPKPVAKACLGLVTSPFRKKVGKTVQNVRSTKCALCAP